MGVTHLRQGLYNTHTNTRRKQVEKKVTNLRTIGATGASPIEDRWKDPSGEGQGESGDVSCPSSFYTFNLNIKTECIYKFKFICFISQRARKLTCCQVIYLINKLFTRICLMSYPFTVILFILFTRIFSALWKKGRIILHLSTIQISTKKLRISP